MSTALFIGRFQPLHKGHIAAIKEILEKHDNIIIGIGSINKKNYKNPFSFSLRKKMIHAVMKKYKGRYTIIGIPDFNNDKKWVSYIQNKARFDIIYTANSWVKRCFHNYSIKSQHLYYPKKYNATRIRGLMRMNKKWEYLVPEEVIKILG